MIKFACSKCGKHIRVDDKYAGKRGKCPGCGAAVVVPAKAAAIAFSCSHCGHTLKVPARYAGRKGKCPKCQHAVVVPAAQEKPAAQPPTPTISCSACGAAIPVTPGATDEFVECPTCGSYIDAATGAAPSPYDEGPSESDDEVAGEAPDEEVEEGGGLDRRLILILSGVAVVVIAILIGVVVVLKSSGPPPAPPRPAAQRAPRGAAEMNPEPQLVVATTEPVETPAEPAPPTSSAEPAAAAPLRLRFAPPTGTQRTMRVATRSLMSVAQAGQQQVLGGTETFTLDLEPAPANADGTVPVKIAIAAVRIESQTGDDVSTVYDSTQPQDDIRGMAAMYAGFVGRRFTAAISARGEIVELALDGLFRAVAEKRVDAEDAQVRATAPSPERAEQAIASKNERFGSRGQRIAAMQQQLEQFPILDGEKLSALVGALVTFLPESPLRPGDRWDRPLGLTQLDSSFQMAGTHTVTAVTDGACTIASAGHRGPEEAPWVQQTGVTVGRADSEATVTVDRATGWVLSKEQTTLLTGQIEAPVPGQPNQTMTTPISIEVSTIVTPVESPADSPAAATVRLRFAPSPGTKRTVRVASGVHSSMPQAGQRQEMLAVESFTVDLEAAPANADGTVPVQVTLVAIQAKTEMGGVTVSEYDSTAPVDDVDPVDAMYVSFIGPSFTVTVSDRGQIVASGLDDLFRAAAENYVQAEDTGMRAAADTPERAEQVIARMNERFGSRAQRIAAAQEKLEQFPNLDRKGLLGLLHDLVTVLPEAPLRQGDRWNRPLRVPQIDPRLALAATDTLTGVTDDSCTIASEGHRRPDEAPLVQESGPITVTFQFGGDSAATLTVDRATGWLLRKEQTMNLAGRTTMSRADKPDRDLTTETTMEITTAVTTLE